MPQDFVSSTFSGEARFAFEVTMRDGLLVWQQDTIETTTV
jgi:hypothetical protein